MGKYDGGNRITAISYNFQPLQEQMGTFPVYNLKDGITQKDIRKYIEKAWMLCQNDIKEFLPEELRQKYRLITRKEALYFIHHPSSKETIRQSLRYLKYEEFLRFQLVMRACKAKEKKISALMYVLAVLFILKYIFI